MLAQPVVVKQPEGEVRGFLVLRSEDGALVANGDSMQTTRNGKMFYRSTYHFKDGSLQDETTVFSQNGHFRVLSDHLIQKGPTFKHPMDVTLNAVSGHVTVIHTDDHGEQKTETKQMNLPPDLANGIVPVLLKNLSAGQSITESMLVASPKPMLVKLQIHAEGEDPFTTGSLSRQATRYNVHVDIGGVKGAVATVIGKQPPDTLVWVLKGDCPTFVRARGATFEDGPIWLTELVSPSFPAGAPASATREKK
ncbi:MAG TPA: hypothetical protein VHW09_12390 [Bryobacteraceae bacterium]|jgi:hypothetical protein|nr:hypothetical protein [Bryobacteraceae bacterium]